MLFWLPNQSIRSIDAIVDYRVGICPFNVEKCDVPTRCCPMVLRMYVFNLRNALNDRCAENSVPGITPTICTTLENSTNTSNRSFSRLSQSRSHGFLVWCGIRRTRRKYDRASRSLSRYALKSSTCEQANHSRTLSPSFLEQTCTLIRAHDEKSRTQFLLGFENLAVDFVIKNLATREKLSLSRVSLWQMFPIARVFRDNFRRTLTQARTAPCRWRIASVNTVVSLHHRRN